MAAPGDDLGGRHRDADLGLRHPRGERVHAEPGCLPLGRAGGPSASDELHRADAQPGQPGRLPAHDRRSGDARRCAGDGPGCLAPLGARADGLGAGRARRAREPRRPRAAARLRDAGAGRGLVDARGRDLRGSDRGRAGQGHDPGPADEDGGRGGAVHDHGRGAVLDLRRRASRGRGALLQPGRALPALGSGGRRSDRHGGRYRRPAGAVRRTIRCRQLRARGVDGVLVLPGHDRHRNARDRRGRGLPVGHPPWS